MSRLSHYYDRQGHPITVAKLELLCRDPAYRVVARDRVGVYLVSTVWLGLDHSLGRGPLLIFETMVFASPECADDFALDLTCDRYSTEDQAVQGHQDMVTLVRATTDEQVPTADTEEQAHGC